MASAIKTLTIAMTAKRYLLPVLAALLLAGIVLGWWLESVALFWLLPLAGLTIWYLLAAWHDRRQLSAAAKDAIWRESVMLAAGESAWLRFRDFVQHGDEAIQALCLPVVFTRLRWWRKNLLDSGARFVCLCPAFPDNYTLQSFVDAADDQQDGFTLLLKGGGDCYAIVPAKGKVLWTLEKRSGEDRWLELRLQFQREGDGWLLADIGSGWLR